MLSGNKGLKKTFCMEICLPITPSSVQTHSVKAEHRKSHLKNSYDCYHGAPFCGVVAECVHLIGFSQHSSAQREGETRRGTKKGRKKKQK